MAEKTTKVSSSVTYFEDASKEPPSLDKAQIFSDPRYLSATSIVDVNNVTRVPLIVINFLLTIASLVAFWSSIFLLFGRKIPVQTTYGGFRSNSLVINTIERPEILVAPLSALLLATASFGFLGGLRENICFLTTNVVLLTIIAVGFIIAAIASILLPPIARNYVKNNVQNDFILAYRDSEDIQSVIDWMQIRYRCCGVTAESYRDWSLNPYFKCDRDNASKERCSVPYSCCKRNESDPHQRILHVMCGAKVLQLNDQDAWHMVYTRGCADAVFASIQNDTVNTFVACLMACLLTLLLMTLAVAVRKEILALSAIYDVYYKNVSRGHKAMAEENISLAKDFEYQPPQATPFFGSARAYLVETLKLWMRRYRNGTSGNHTSVV